MFGLRNLISALLVCYTEMSLGCPLDQIFFDDPSARMALHHLLVPLFPHCCIRLKQVFLAGVVSFHTVVSWGPCQNTHS